jgi:hypothetical protein
VGGSDLSVSVSLGVRIAGRALDFGVRVGLLGIGVAECAHCGGCHVFRIVVLCGDNGEDDGAQIFHVVQHQLSNQFDLFLTARWSVVWQESHARSYHRNHFAATRTYTRASPQRSSCAAMQRQGTAGRLQYCQRDIMRQVRFAYTLKKKLRLGDSS